MLMSEKAKKFLDITHMGKQEFSRRAGISPSTFEKLLNGEDVSIQTIDLCQFLMQKTLQDLIAIAK